ncbi:MAG: class I SAM-dependent methyltransferase [Oscillospiraceae bacterium]
METLDNRMKTVADMVRCGVRIADVGCDHGMLITELCEKGKILGGVATDINEGPLNKARFRVMGLNLEDKIDLLRTDGLDGVDENMVEDVVIAGMGGELIFKIISDCPWSRNPKKSFVLQPMTKAVYLRQALLAAGFGIDEERAAVAVNRHYSVMRCHYCGEKRNLSEFDEYLYVGELPRCPSPQAGAYMEGEMHLLLKKAEGLKEKDPTLSQKYFEVVERIGKLKEGL